MSAGKDLEGCAFFLRALGPDAVSYRGFCGQQTKLPSFENYEVEGSRVPLKELLSPIPFGYKELIPLFGVGELQDGDVVATVLTHPVEFWTVGVAAPRRVVNEEADSCHYPAFIEGDRFLLHLNYNPMTDEMVKHLKEKMNV